MPSEFITQLYGPVLQSGKVSLDNFVMSLFLVVIFFVVDDMLGNMNAKIFFLLGFFINIVLFYTVAHLCFRKEKAVETQAAEGGMPFAHLFTINFSIYLLSFSVAYWIFLNFQAAGTGTTNMPLLFIYYITVVISYLLYVVYLSKLCDIQYAIGSALFGILSGLGWASIIQSLIKPSVSSMPPTALGSDKIIDLTSDPNVTCQAFRL